MNLKNSDMLKKENFSDRFSKEMRMSDMTYKDLNFKIYCLQNNTAKSYYSADSLRIYASGERSPSLHVIDLISKILKVSPVWLAFGVGNRDE